MADKRISELNSITTLVDDDLLIASDSSSSETKKVTFLNIFQFLIHIHTRPHFKVTTHTKNLFFCQNT